MKQYPAQDIRTIAFVGHQKCGKTSLAEAILFDTKAVNRLGKVDDESSNLDTEPEEHKRKSSIHLSLGYCEWAKKKINFIDAPGDANFASDADQALSAVDAVVLVVSAPDGVQVGTERAWEQTVARNLPRAIFINKLDRERANFNKALDEINSTLSQQAVPLQVPIGSEGSFKGVVDLLANKAYTFGEDGRKVEVGDVPADLADQCEEMREKLIEGIASADDALLEKYLETMELSEEEIHQGLNKGISSGAIVPVVCGSATVNIGVQPLLDLIANTFPSPVSRPPIKTADGKELAHDAPMAAQVFKTITADIGRIALLRVWSGELKADSDILNSSRDRSQRVGQLYAMIGHKRESVPAFVAGDLVGIGKLKDTDTGETLCDGNNSVVLPPPERPEPLITYAISPKTKGDEEKMASKLHDILVEDISLRLDRAGSEILLRGMGQVHVDSVVERLKRMGVEVELSLPTIAYRETIRGKASDVEGKHKKQSGGRGQFGVCYIDMEPGDTDAEDPLEFVNAIFGGSIPKQFIPSVEKGIRARMARGVVAGFPVVGVKVTLKDGKYHSVDSDGRSFEMAGSKGFQEAVKKARPALLEPVMNVTVTCPDENMGDIFGDVSSRRGKVLGSEAKGKKQIIKAQVPEAEMLRYAIDLESLTGGRGSFSMSFAHYEDVPAQLAEEIIAKAQVEEDED
ncbi:MAG: elongation factor G [Myxococcales bacterium]|nr:elongation factor G [Myxococcales bacterium]